MGMNNHISWQNQIFYSQNGLKAAWRPPNAEFAHLFIHAGAGDAEGAGCLGDVPVVIAEGEEDGLRFAVLDDGLELPVRARRFRNGLLAEFRGQVGQGDLVARTQAQRPDEHVAQFPDVAGPPVAHKRIHGAFRTLDPFAAHAVEDIARDQRDVFHPFAQGRKVEGHGIDAVIQILAERPRRDHFLEVAVGCGDKPEIHDAGL